MRGRILVVEEDPERREAIELALAPRGYEILCADEVVGALRGQDAAGIERERHAALRPVVAASSAMIEVLERLEHLASGDEPVRIHGEPGTGKETLAHVLHAQSARRNDAFVVLDVRGSDEESLHAALLGEPARPDPRRRHPTPGRLFLADGGTLYVDGIEALPLALQDVLLQVLDHGTALPPGSEKARRVSLRLVAATTASLAEATRAGAFRRELHERLAPATLRVPPLRERTEDLPLLIDQALRATSDALRRDLPRLENEALSRLVAHRWPGNLRELDAVVVQALLRATGQAITSRALPETLTSGSGDSSLALKAARRDFEAEWIRRALRATRGNRTHAARLLEISHRALLYKLKEYGIRD